MSQMYVFFESLAQFCGRRNAFLPNCRTGRPILCVTTWVPVYGPRISAHRAPYSLKTCPVAPSKAGARAAVWRKGRDIRVTRRYTGIQRPDCHNPKFAELSDMPLRPMEGRLRSAAQQICRARAGQYTIEATTIRGMPLREFRVEHLAEFCRRKGKE